MKQAKLRRLQREIKQHQEFEQIYKDKIKNVVTEITEEDKQEMEEDGFTMVTDKKAKKGKKKFQ